MIYYIGVVDRTGDMNWTFLASIITSLSNESDFTFFSDFRQPTTNFHFIKHVNTTFYVMRYGLLDFGLFLHKKHVRPWKPMFILLNAGFSSVVPKKKADRTNFFTTQIPFARIFVDEEQFKDSIERLNVPFFKGVRFDSRCHIFVVESNAVHSPSSITNCGQRNRDPSALRWWKVEDKVIRYKKPGAVYRETRSRGLILAHFNETQAVNYDSPFIHSPIFS